MPSTSVNVVFKVSTQNIKRTSAGNALSVAPATARRARELFKFSNWKFETGFEESSDVGIQVGKLLPNLKTWFASVCELESYIQNPFGYEFALVISVVDDKYPLTLINGDLIEFASLAGMKISVETKHGESSREDQRAWTNVEFAAFSLRSGLDPAVVSSTLGFEPSILKSDCWSISSGFWLTSKADSLVEDTLKPLFDKTDELLELKAEYGMAYRLIITMDTGYGLTGKVSFPKSVVEFLDKVKAYAIVNADVEGTKLPVDFEDYDDPDADEEF
jgi:hypothetical protein